MYSNTKRKITGKITSFFKAVDVCPAKKSNKVCPGGSEEKDINDTEETMPNVNNDEMSITDIEVDNEGEDLGLDNDSNNENSNPNPPAEIISIKSKPVYFKYSWLVRTSEGYKCKICNENSVLKHGPWITQPIALSKSKKLSEKCEKHANSGMHKAAITAFEIFSASNVNVLEQVVVHSTKQKEKGANNVKDLLCLAYYLFKMEIPHTTENWPALITNAAAVDKSGDLSKSMVNSPGNAHRLSAKSATGFLEAFSSALTQQITKRFEKNDAYAVMADECTDINGREILSIIIRHINKHDKKPQVQEVFLCVLPLTSATGEQICETLVGELRKVYLDPKNIFAASFDGGSNFSGKINGVYGRLKEYSADLLFVHCRNHVLQLALVNSCQKSPEIKRVLSAVNSLYTTFKGRHKRLNVLEETEKALDGRSHKLVQPGATRWLSYDNSVKIVMKHHASICVALEHIYVDGGNCSSEAGGLLLTLKKTSTIFTLVLLQNLLSLLGRLSKSLQAACGNMTESMALVEAVQSSVKYISMEDVQLESEEIIEKAIQNNVNIERDNAENTRKTIKALSKYRDSVEENLRKRFNDKFKALVKLHTILMNKVESADFEQIAEICSVDAENMKDEFKIYRRYPGDIHTHESFLSLACEETKQIMFPALSAAAEKILLLPVGTACVERSFSTMKRILCSERSRLLPNHTNDLMKVSIEGAAIPEIRGKGEESEQEWTAYNKIIEDAYKCWLKVPRRF